MLNTIKSKINSAFLKWMSIKQSRLNLPTIPRNKLIPPITREEAFNILEKHMKANREMEDAFQNSKIKEKVKVIIQKQSFYSLFNRWEKILVCFAIGTTLTNLKKLSRNNIAFGSYLALTSGVYKGLNWFFTGRLNHDY